MVSHPDRLTEPREIVSQRVIDAPREAVYGAFAEPSVLALWWGPEGFSTTFHEFDLRPGGALRFTMYGPEGAEYSMTREVIDVIPLERVLLRHRQPMHNFDMTMLFEDEAGGTRLTWRMYFDTEDEAELVREAMAAGNEQNFDRLERQLGTMQSGGAG